MTITTTMRFTGEALEDVVAAGLPTERTGTGSFKDLIDEAAFYEDDGAEFTITDTETGDVITAGDMVDGGNYIMTMESLPEGLKRQISQ